MIRVLREAGDIVSRRWRSIGKGWKVLLIIGIIIASLLGIVYLFLRLVVGLLRSLSVGGYRNRALYIPSMRRRIR